MREDLTQNLAHQVSIRNAHQVHVLLQEGANPDEPNGLPLWNAALNGDAYITILLLNYGATLDVKVPFGFNTSDETTALMCAAHRGHEEVISLLLEAGANINYMVGGVKTALNFASNAGRTRTVQLLLQAQAFNTDVLGNEFTPANGLYEASEYWSKQKKFERTAAEFCEQERFAKAEPIYWQMLREAANANVELRKNEIAKCLNLIARLYVGWRRTHLAEQIYDHLLPMHKAPLDTNNVKTYFPLNRAEWINSVCVLPVYVGSDYNLSICLIRQLKPFATGLSYSNKWMFLKLIDVLLSLYVKHHNQSEASIFVRETVSDIEKRHGEEHPLTIALLEHIGNWHQKQSSYQEAASIYERIAALYKSESSVGYRWQSSTLEHLAFSCYTSADYAQAEPMYLEVLRRTEASSAHVSIKRPETVRLLDRIAQLYAEWKKYSKAEEIYRRLLIMHKADASHEQNPMHLTGLVALLKMQGKYQKPERLTARLLEIYRTALGPEHPYTLYALDNLADIYKTQLEHERAKTTYLQLLVLQEKLFGPMHPKCIRSLDGLKTVYTRQDDKAKLESVYLRLIERRKQVIGVNHPDTGQNINNLASLYAHQGRDEEAARLYAELVEIYKSGSEASKLKAAQNNLDRLTRKLNGSSSAPASPTKKNVTSGYAIPAPPKPPQAKTFALDMSSVQQKIAETAQVQELLQAQFVEEEKAAPFAPAAASVSDATVSGSPPSTRSKVWIRRISCF